MNPTTIYFSCLVIIIGSLVMSACAQRDEQFESERAALIKIYRKPEVHRCTLMRYYPDLMGFYEKYRARLALTPENREKADNALSEHKSRPIVEGACPQGMWWIFIPAVAEIILEQTGLINTTTRPY